MRYIFTLFACFQPAWSRRRRRDRFFRIRTSRRRCQTGLKPLSCPCPVRDWRRILRFVRTGSRDEVEAGKSGFAHFFEHMMFRGTKKYPGPMYDSICTGMGANANASTTDDFTMFFISFAKDNLEKVIELESDRFQNLSYLKPAFQTEAGAVYGEYRKDVTNPFFLLEEKLADRAYDVHTYKHTTMGFEAEHQRHARGLRLQPVRFFKRYYRPENVVILVVGDVEAKTVFFP